MKYKAAFVFILILIFPAILFAWEGKVVSVTDGDTIKVLQNGTQVKIRLAAIDCPEKGQPYGQTARKFTADLVAGKIVRIWPADTDRYGRTVAFVFVGSTDLNKELLKAGLAWHYKQYSRDPELAKLEFEARSKKVGLWKEPGAIAPWEWRKQKKNKKTKFEFSGGISTTIEH
jgi:micrococcal nuclease